MLLLLACAPEPVSAPNTDTVAETGLEAPGLVSTSGVCWCDVQPDDRLAPVLESSDLGRVHDPSGTAFAWPNMDPERDGRSLRFGQTDQTFAVLQDYGMSQWVTLMTDVAPALQPDTLAPLRLPSDEEAWMRFVTALVERYDGDGVDDMPGLVTPVVAWEVGNEPEEFISPKDYARLVYITALAVREADPNALVLNGGAKPLALTADDEPYLTWWANYVHYGGLAHIDRFQFHEAVGRARTVEATLSVWRDVVGDELPFWIGESGPVDHDGSSNLPAEARPDWTRGHLDSALEQVDRICLCGASELVRSEHDAVLDVVLDLNGR